MFDRTFGFLDHTIVDVIDDEGAVWCVRQSISRAPRARRNRPVSSETGDGRRDRPKSCVRAREYGVEVFWRELHVLSSFLRNFSFGRVLFLLRRRHPNRTSSKKFFIYTCFCFPFPQ